MNLNTILLLLTSIIIFTIGLFVYTRNKKSIANRTFSALSLSLTIWLLGFSCMYSSKNANTALIFARIGFLGIAFIPILSYHFISVFLNHKNPKFLLSIYIMTIILLPLSFTDYIYNGVKMRFFGYYPTAGKIYPIFLIAFIVLFLKGLYLLYTYYKKETKRNEQIKYVMLGFFIGTFGVVDYLVKFQPFHNIYPFGYICAIGFYSIISYAIVKYHLMDINIVIKKSTLFAYRVIFPVFKNFKIPDEFPLIRVLKLQ